MAKIETSDLTLAQDGKDIYSWDGGLASDGKAYKHREFRKGVVEELKKKAGKEEFEAADEALNKSVASLEKDVEELRTGLDKLSGGRIYNVTNEQPLESGYYDKDTAVAAMADAGINDDMKPGMILTFEASAGVWEDYRYVADDIANFLVPASWEEYGKIKSISLNGEGVEPDPTGHVALVIDQMQVDESLDADSTNPVQNAAVAKKIAEIGDAAVGGIEVIPDGDKNTLNILNKQGGIIASAEFSGGGGGSAASRIILTAALDKAQVKEGGKAELTYTYKHVNSEGDATGIKADITITVSRGATTTYQQTVNGVGAGTYTLDISDYLLAGTTDVYVKAAVITEDGAKQTKQAYTSINVITLTLKSGYNLATTIAGGGYKDGDTIEIPFTITGSGTKDVSMYLDGTDIPVSQTVNKSGTVNGSFTISASSLSAGRHTVQLVAERGGLKSDSIYIDILKAGLGIPFVGIKYTDKSGAILTTTHFTPILQASQYEQVSFSFIAYDPSGTPATVKIYLNGDLANTVSVPRSMQTYTKRFISQGMQTLKLTVGMTEYTLNVDVTESSIDIAEVQYGLVAKFDASGRSNSESDPAQWESNGIKTVFENFDWNSNGWTGESLKLTNGAKATINYQPFAADVKSTGVTIEMTMKVSNVTSRNAAVVSCINNNKGLYVTAENASFKTGQTVDYTNEDDELVSREIKLGTNYVPDKWFKIALVISTRNDSRLMHIYVNGNRTGADIYDTSFNFAQDVPQNIVIDSSEADVEVRNVRIYNRAISDDEELENCIVDAETTDSMMALYEDNNILGDTGGVDMDKIRAKGKGVLRIVRPNKLDDVYAENNKKTDFKADVYFYSPFGKEYDFVLMNCNIRIQGTSSTKYPSKNIRIYFNKGGDNLSLAINGELNPYGSNKYKMRPGAIPMNLYTMKSDYSDSSMSMNTGGAKLFNDVLKELGLLTPPQRYEYEHGANQIVSIKARTAIDGFPIDIFCAETVDGESEYYGQYNFNNEKSKSEDLFGMTGIDGFEPAMPMTFESLNNGEKMCLFQSSSDDEIPTIFDAALETNYPDDVKWAGLTGAQQNAVKRLYGWIRNCVPADANSNNIKSFVSQKFKDEIDQYFDKDFILTYYLWTDYYLAVDQRAKNMMLRTWDGLKWYITYYDGDTQMGKRNDCFLVYTYTTDRDTYDAEASKYAFEGRDSWLWNLVLANLEDDLKRCAANLRSVMTNERVLEMFNMEQSGNWSDRAFNKSGEIKYIRPAVQEMYGKVWPFIYALQGSNTAHREYFIKNRFALLDAKYSTSNFTSDNVDMYISRSASDEADVVKITANEVYAFGYGTNNSPNIENTGIIQEGDVATLNISRGFTVNDPIRLYGASRIKVLDMTGAADHLKNGLDLGKCNVLRELNLQSETNGSTGWWLVLNACRSLRRLDVRNQQQAKTGSSTSKELDLSNQTKLEYIDARGTAVESVVFAKGAPLTEAHLPGTLTVLRLEYLARLMPSGLSVENYANVGTFIFSECPNLDWQAMLDRCTNVQHIRVTGIDMEGDGALLDKYMAVGGVDVDGNYTDTCGLVGVYRLTKYVEDDIYNAYVSHYPELNVTLPQYSMIYSDDDVADDKNYTNPDNKTGYDYGNDYVPNGHVAKILSTRCGCLGKQVSDGEMTICRLNPEDFNYYGDGTSLNNSTSAKLNGDEGDAFIYEPRYWYKGINDILGAFSNGVSRKYSCYSSNENMPNMPKHKRVTFDELKGLGFVTKGYKVNVGFSVVSDAIISDSSYTLIKVDVEGYKVVRYPTITNITAGSCFSDNDGNVLSSSNVADAEKFIDGMYVLNKIPSQAKFLYFTINNKAFWDDVILSRSDKVEDMEPDWVEHVPCLTGMFESVFYQQNIHSIAVGINAASLSKEEHELYAVKRNLHLIDYEMHKDVANLFFAKYGRRNSQDQCGNGSDNSKIAGNSAFMGMTDTFNKNGGLNDPFNPNTNEKALHVRCLGYEGWFGYNDEIMVGFANKLGEEQSIHITSYNGEVRKIRKTQNSSIAGFYQKHIHHQKYMDLFLHRKNASGSGSTFYCDGFELIQKEIDYVYRGKEKGSSYGYGPGVSAIGIWNIFDAASRIAFRGVIKEAASVSAYKELEAKY